MRRRGPTGRTWFKVAGGILVAVAGVGFITVADELRHIGEFFAVLGILLSGVSLLVAGFSPRVSRILAPQWVPLGIAMGMLGGAAADRTVSGVSLGVGLGLVLARAFRTRSSQGDSRSRT
jgi:hypothetical protein